MSSTLTGAGRRAKISVRTFRTDKWWLFPLANAVALGIFLLYATVRLFWDKSYFVEDFHYIAPFYSPCRRPTAPTARRRSASPSARCRRGCRPP